MAESEAGRRYLCWLEVVRDRKNHRIHRKHVCGLHDSVNDLHLCFMHWRVGELLLVAVADGAAEFLPDVLHPPGLLERVEAFEGREVLEVVTNAFEDDLLVVVELFAKLSLKSFKIDILVLSIFDMLSDLRL